jgi:hypothetical protein
MCCRYTSCPGCNIAKGAEKEPGHSTSTTVRDQLILNPMVQYAVAVSIALETFFLKEQRSHMIIYDTSLHQRLHNGGHLLSLIVTIYYAAAAAYTNALSSIITTRKRVTTQASLSPPHLYPFAVLVGD